MAGLRFFQRLDDERTQDLLWHHQLHGSGIALRFAAAPTVAALPLTRAVCVRALQEVTDLVSGTAVYDGAKADIWSLGVILYELSAGRTMFNQDTSNDQLVEEADEVRLCTWETISPERLAPVFVRHHDLAGNHLGCILLKVPAISLLTGRGRDP